MGGKSDEIKGRVKEAAGAVTDNDELRREGRADQAVGKAKQAITKTLDNIEDAAHAVADKAKKATNKM